jgi:hypothetical protein
MRAVQDYLCYRTGGPHPSTELFILRIIVIITDYYYLPLSLSLSLYSRRYCVFTTRMAFSRTPPTSGLTPRFLPLRERTSGSRVSRDGQHLLLLNADPERVEKTSITSCFLRTLYVRLLRNPSAPVVAPVYACLRHVNGVAHPNKNSNATCTTSWRVSALLRLFLKKKKKK